MIVVKVPLLKCCKNKPLVKMTADLKLIVIKKEEIACHKK